ncbi:MAG: MBL fold metallo-hydrolase [Negativicutes bacterium]
MRKWFRKMLVSLVMILVVLSAGVSYYLQQPKFGRAPEGLRLGKMQSSINYFDGQFQNLVPTPQIIGDSWFSTMWKFLFVPKERPKPIDSIPTIKTDLMALDKTKDIVIWLGHSSYYMQVGGKRILIDPVFSSSAAPVSFANKAFAGSNLYTLHSRKIIPMTPLKSYNIDVSARFAIDILPDHWYNYTNDRRCRDVARLFEK